MSFSRQDFRNSSSNTDQPQISYHLETLIQMKQRLLNLIAHSLFSSTTFILKMYLEQVNNLKSQFMGQIYIIPLEELALQHPHKHSNVRHPIRCGQV